MDELIVEFNRDGMDTITPETATFETNGEFTLHFQTHGRPARAYLRLDGDLATVASLPDHDYLVTPEEPVTVPVAFQAEPTAVTGTLTIETGYGATGQTITIDVDPDRRPDVEPTPASTEQDDPSTTASSDGWQFQPNFRIIAILAASVPAVGAVALALQNIGTHPVVVIGSALVLATVILGLGYLLVIPTPR